MSITIDTPEITSGLTVRPVTGRIGAVVEGVDLASPLPDEVIADIRRALVRHRVIFFRDQHLSSEAQVAFAERFGPLTLAHPNVQGTGEADARVLPLGGKANHWHSDVSFVDHPPFASVLAQVSTPDVGADTAWADAVTAYETLPEPLQRLADSIDVLHSNTFDYARLTLDPKEREQLAKTFASSPFETAHPAVRLIAETNERALFLGGFATRIVGFSPRQSQALLDLLQDHIVHVDHTVRWRWAPGDVAFWDNRSAQHTLVDDLPDYEGRRLRRVTIAGGRAVAPDGRTSRAITGDAAYYTPLS